MACARRDRLIVPVARAAYSVRSNTISSRPWPLWFLTGPVTVKAHRLVERDRATVDRSCHCRHDRPVPGSYEPEELLVQQPAESALAGGRSHPHEVDVCAIGS